MSSTRESMRDVGEPLKSLLTVMNSITEEVLSRHRWIKNVEFEMYANNRRRDHVIIGFSGVGKAEIFVVESVPIEKHIATAEVSGRTVEFTYAKVGDPEREVYRILGEGDVGLGAWRAREYSEALSRYRNVLTTMPSIIGKVVFKDAVVFSYRGTEYIVYLEESDIEVIDRNVGTLVYLSKTSDWYYISLFPDCSRGLELLEGGKFVTLLLYP